MSAVSQIIPSLIGGVSQQPDTLKLPNQLRKCDNFFPDPTFGLAKRPGLQGIRKLSNAGSDATWFSIFRDDREKYLGQFTRSGVLTIWDANTGEEKVINTVDSGATAYAVHTEPGDLEVLQINDFIFVLNRKVTVLEDVNNLTAAQDPFAIVTINVVAYASTYTVTLDGTDFSYATPTTSTTQLNVKNIVDSLVTAINANPTWSALAIGNNIFIEKDDQTDFAIEVKGGNTGTALEAFKGVVPTSGQLPKQFIDGKKIKVSGSAENNNDDYWVEFKTSDGTSTGVGSWTESVGSEVIVGLDPETMPHVIIREADGTFTYRVLDETSAQASPGVVTIAGIPTFVSIDPNPQGRYAVGQIFTCTGGSGSDLRLRVDKVRTDQFPTDYPYSGSSTNFVERVTTTTFIRFQSITTTTYTWVVNNVQIASRSDDNPFSIGSFNYSRIGGYTQISSSIARSGIRIVETRSDVLDRISIKQAGLDYVALETVSNASGDTFTIDTVTTKATEGDAIANTFWQNRKVGDDETNPAPTFVGNQISGISFFKNRLILLSRENVICSQAGSYFDFYASTVITSVQNDPIDISCSSVRPIQLTYALQVSRGLLLFSENAQYILETTTDAFAADTAEVNLVSNYNQNERLAPVNTGSSVVFTEEGDKATNVFEMAVGENIGSRAQVIELTRTIPSYIPASITSMRCSAATSTIAMLTAQERNAVYIFRFFNNGQQRVMASWFKWIMPGEVEMIEFDHDVMFVVLKQDSNYVLTKATLLTDTPNGAVLFEGQYIDLKLDLFDYLPTLIYDAVADETHVCFKEGFENFDQQVILVSLDEADAGTFFEVDVDSDLTQPVGEQYFVTLEGDQTGSKFALGYKFVAEATIPSFFLSTGEDAKDTVNIPTIHRIKINSYNSGPYRVLVDSKNRPEFNITLPQINSNEYEANTLPIIRNAQSTVPILAKGTETEVTLLADGVLPTAFTSIAWEGTYNNKGIRMV